MDKFFKLSYDDMMMLLEDYDKLIEDNIEYETVIQNAFIIGKILGQNEVLEYVSEMEKVKY